MVFDVKTQWCAIDVPHCPNPMEAYLALPEGNIGPWPAIVLWMEIFGVNQHIQSVAQRIAAQGYVVLAPNYYHRTTANLNLGYTEADVAIGREHKAKTTEAGVLIDAQSCIRFLQSLPEVNVQSRMGSIGFCFGGHVAYRVATLHEFAVTAAFYGGGIVTLPLTGTEATTLSHTHEIKGAMMALYGEQDPLIPISEMEAVSEALKSAAIPHEVIRYPQAGHGFCCDARADFQPEAAQDAWSRVFTRFSQELKTPSFA